MSPICTPRHSGPDDENVLFARSLCLPNVLRSGASELHLSSVQSRAVVQQLGGIRSPSRCNRSPFPGRAAQMRRQRPQLRSYRGSFPLEQME